MPIVVHIPTQLRSLTGGSSRVEVEATTVAEAVAALEAAHPGFQARLLDDRGEVRPYVNLFVDDNDIRVADGLATRLQEDQTIFVVPAVAGG